MKILAIQGSPRLEGNTQAVLDIVLEAARQAGAETETVQLSQLKIRSGCLECFTCQQSPDEPGCVVQDDMQGVLAKVLETDVVVWAIPVFCWSPSWLAKMAMDRFYCVFKFKEDGQFDSLVEGRKVAAVITAGGSENDGADLVQETCKRLAEFSKGQWLGAFVAANVANPEAIRADAALLERARQFGRALASEIT